MNPFDNQLLLVQWRAKITPGKSIAQFAEHVRTNMPNVTGVIVKVLDGNEWMVAFDDAADPMAITGPERIAEWVNTLAQHNLGVHVWCVPNGYEARTGRYIVPEETDMVIQAAQVTGVKSLILDLEVEPITPARGRFNRLYWKGGPDEARDFMQRLRNGLPNTHIGFCLDARRPNEFLQRVDPFLEGIDSFHPQTYPILFQRPVAEVMKEAFNNLRRYNKPIIPMLQASFDIRRPTNEEISQQVEWARVLGASGVSLWRLGVDRQTQGDNKKCMGEDEYRAISALAWPKPAAIPEAPAPAPAKTFSWQDLFNAMATVAKVNNTAWGAWFDASGAAALFQNNPQFRQTPYSGPRIDTWAIPKHFRDAILEILNNNNSQAIAQIWEQVKNGATDALKPRTRMRGSGIGMHGAPGHGAPPTDKREMWIGYLKDIGAKWFKQLDNGDPNRREVLDWCIQLKKAGIEPIVRFYVDKQFPDPLPEYYYQKMRMYAAAGITFAEIGNEPVLDYEWKEHWRGRIHQQGHDDPEVVPLLARGWVNDAQKTLAAGMRPAFYALGVSAFNNGVDAPWSTVRFAQKLTKYLAAHHRQETLDIFRRGGWIAVHVATYEKPPDFDPHSGMGGFWDMCLRGYEIVTECFTQAFGSDLKMDDIPLISTEGGIFTPESGSWAGHDRPRTEEEHAARAIEMFRWLDQHSPMLAMCPWCLSVGSLIGHGDPLWGRDGWIEQSPQGQLRERPVIAAMRSLRKEFEALNQPRDLRLMIPYHSQTGVTAASHSGDCGPTCIAMLINSGRAVQAYTTVDQLYARHLPNKAFGEFTAVWELENLLRAEQIQITRKQYADATQATREFRELLNKHQSAILLIKYAPLRVVTGESFAGGHFLVLAGYTADAQGNTTGFFVHDPLPAESTQRGAYLHLSISQLMEACGTCHLDGNPNFLVLVSDQPINALKDSNNANRRRSAQKYGWDSKTLKMMPAGEVIGSVIVPKQ